MANTATTKTKLESAGSDRPKSAERTTRTAAQEAEGWGDSARRFVRKNPAGVFIGAFIIGVALAKVARHA
jgi:hypothetical protein